MPIENIPNDVLGNPQLASVAVDNEAKADTEKRRAGFFGRVFGTGQGATINIVGFVLILFVIAVVVAAAVDMIGIKSTNSTMDAKVFFDYVTPIITTIIGFLFGRKALDDD